MCASTTVECRRNRTPASRAISTRSALKSPCEVKTYAPGCPEVSVAAPEAARRRRDLHGDAAGHVHRRGRSRRSAMSAARGDSSFSWTMYVVEPAFPAVIMPPTMVMRALLCPAPFAQFRSCCRRPEWPGRSSTAGSARSRSGRSRRRARRSRRCSSCRAR